MKAKQIMTKKTQMILNKTIDLLIQNGVKKTTMDDIAEYANTSKVTIYRYFTDKDGLFYVIGKTIFSRYASFLESVITSDAAYKLKLFNYLDILNEFFSSGKLELCNELVKYNFQIAEEHLRYEKSHREAMMCLIDEGLEKGYLKSALNRDAIFFYIDMGILYYQQNQEYRNKLQNDKVFQQRFLLFYISHIFTDGAEVLT